MDTLFNDLKFAARILFRSPLYAAVSVITLALAVGANTAIFTVVHGVLIERLPYPEPDELIRVFESSRTYPLFPMSPANFLDYRAGNDVFDGFALFMRDDLQLAESERPEQLKAMRVSHDFFRVLGFEPVLGRTFIPEEELTGKHHIAILGDRLWRNRFGRDPDIIGRSINLSGAPYTVIGVMPPGLQHVGGSFRSVPHGEELDVWRPLPLGPNEQPRGSHYVNVIGRLRKGVRPEEAEAALNAIAESLERQYPDTNEGWRIRLMPLREEIVGGARPMLLILLGASGFVLLIACVNLASLTLARARARGREIALRKAVGACRSHLIRQWLTESLLLASLGGCLGIAFAVWGVPILVLLSPRELPRLHMIDIDPAMFVFAFATTVVTGFLFGLAPAFRSDRWDLAESLRSEGRGSAGDRRGLELHRLLVIAEVSLAFVLLVGTGLLLQSFIELRRSDPGFRPDGVLTASTNLPPARYPEDADRLAFVHRLIDHVGSLPGVESFAVSSDVPWTGYDVNTSFDIEGWTPPPDVSLHSRYHYSSPDYFRTVGIPLLEGRFFTRGDDAESPRVVLINRSMARRYWEDREAAAEPVGSRVQLWGETRTIIGIVGDVKDSPDASEAEPALYFPLLQQPTRNLVLTVRTTSDPMSFAESLRREVLAVDPELPIAETVTLSSIAVATTSDEQFALLVVGLFATLALTLAAVGIYGVVSYAVNCRTRELAVRMAIGATRMDILRLVLRHGLTPVEIGLIIGLIESFALTRFMSSLLYGVSVLDAATFAGVSLTLMVVATAACYLPAHRASRVEPSMMLR